MKNQSALQDKLFTLISQDLKQPMGDLNGSLDLLSPLSSELDPEHKESLLKEMKLSTRAAQFLLENLQAWARFQVAGLESARVPLIAHDAILSAVSKLSYLWKPKDQNIRMEAPDGLVLIADPFLLSTVLRNLLSNAIKFSPRGGEILVKAGWNPEARWIRIEDRGLGLPEGDVKEIFRLRIAPSRLGTEGERGSGFGLWLSLDLVRRMKGRFLIRGTPGGGTTILLKFPEEPVEELDSTDGD